MINDPFPYGWYMGFDTFKKYKAKAVWWTIRNWFRNLRYLGKSIKWFFQRGSRGWADCDWWNMNCYLAQIIIPMLKKLKEDGMGYPGCDDASTPEDWDARLDEMIEAFEAAERVMEDEYYKTVSPDFPEKKATHKEVLQWIAMSKKDQKLFNKKIKVFVKWFFSLWD